MDETDFHAAALIGQTVAVNTIGRLVRRHILSREDALEIIEASLANFEAFFATSPAPDPVLDRVRKLLDAAAMQIAAP